MEQINRHNYEAYFLDYWEGRLSKAKRTLVEEFVDRNPELKSTFTQGIHAPLKKGSDENLDWSYLKHPVSPHDWTLEEREKLYFRVSDGLASVEDLDNLGVLQLQETTAQEAAGWQNLKLLPTTEFIETADSYHFDFDCEINTSNYAEFADAREADLLSFQQETRLKGFEKTHSDIVRDFRPMALKPSPFLRMSEKADLRKREARVIPLWVIRTAAAAAILIGAIWVFQVGDQPANSVAENSAKQESLLPAVENSTIEDAENEGDLDSTENSEVEILTEKTSPLKTDERLKVQGKREMPQQRKGEPMEYAAEERPASQAIGSAAIDVAPIDAKPIDRIAADENGLAESSHTATQRTPENRAVAGENADYLTLAELAKARFGSELNIPEEERDQPMKFLAKRVADNTGKLINAEVKIKDNPSGEREGWAIRLGDLAISHSRSSNL